TLKFAKLLSCDIRLQIVRCLTQEPSIVGDMCHELGEVRDSAFMPMSQPSVSHHLALLRCARYIDFHKKGKCNRYDLRAEYYKDMHAFCAIVGQLADASRTVHE